MINTQKRLPPGTYAVDAVEVTNTMPPQPIVDLTTVKLGDELLSEAITEPTLDRWLDNSPKNNTDQDYLELVLNLRRKREMFITAEQKKKEPKIEGETDEQV